MALQEFKHDGSMGMESNLKETLWWEKSLTKTSDNRLSTNTIPEPELLYEKHNYH